MKCKDCTVHDCTYRDKDGNTKCYYETPYWNHFRAEAAKDILCSVLNGGIASGATGFMNEKEDIVKGAIDVADELIKQLKEKEK